MLRIPINFRVRCIKPSSLPPRAIDSFSSLSGSTGEAIVAAINAATPAASFPSPPSGCPSGVGPSSLFSSEVREVNISFTVDLMRSKNAGRSTVGSSTEAACALKELKTSEAESLISVSVSCADDIQPDVCLRSSVEGLLTHAKAERQRATEVPLILVMANLSTTLCVCVNSGAKYHSWTTCILVWLLGGWSKARPNLREEIAPSSVLKCARRYKCDYASSSRCSEWPLNTPPTGCTQQHQPCTKFGREMVSVTYPPAYNLRIRMRPRPRLRRQLEHGKPVRRILARRYS